MAKRFDSAVMRLWSGLCNNFTNNKNTYERRAGLYIIVDVDTFDCYSKDSWLSDWRSQDSLFPPTLWALPCSSLGSTLVVVTLRHGRHFLLQPPHLLAVLPANLPVRTQGFTGMGETQRVTPTLTTTPCCRCRKMVKNSPVSLCEPSYLLSVVPLVWAAVCQSCVQWVLD